MEDYLTKMGRGATNQTEHLKDTIADIPFILPPKSIAEYFELTCRQHIQANSNSTSRMIS